MRYVLMICTDETADEALSPQEASTRLGKYAAFGEEMGSRGVLQAGALAGYHLLPATRADLLRRLGRDVEAAAAYRAALALAATDAERRYLARRLGETAGG